MHIVLYYTHDTTIFSSDPAIYYLILAILVRAQSNFVPDFTGTGKAHFFVDRYIGQTFLCVVNIHRTIVDCFVLEAFREYRDDLRDHMSDNTQNIPKSELRKVTLSVM